MTDEWEGWSECWGEPGTELQKLCRDERDWCYCDTSTVEDKVYSSIGISTVEGVLTQVEARGAV
jgi:hypothetical protein